MDDNGERNSTEKAAWVEPVEGSATRAEPVRFGNIDEDVDQDHAEAQLSGRSPADDDEDFGYDPIFYD